MIFLDESGDDGKYIKSNSNFFVVAINIFDNEKYKGEYKKLQKIMKRDRSLLKWYGFKDWQKEEFIKYSKNIDYKITAFWVDKSKQTDFDNLYYLIAEKLFGSLSVNNSTIFYSGLHLKNMFEKVRRRVKAKNKNYKFTEASGEELYGVAIADLWAGYINYAMKNNLEIPASDNLVIREYLE